MLTAFSFKNNIHTVEALATFSIEDGITYSTNKRAKFTENTSPFTLTRKKSINDTESIHREGRAALAISSINQGQIENVNYAVAIPIVSVNSIPTLTKEPKLMLLASHTPAAPLSGG